MVVATSEAEKGYKDFRSSGAEWAWKFTILRARVLHWRGLDGDALKLLTSEPAPPPLGETAVQRLRWQGLADASLHKFDEADHVLGQAEHLCSVTRYPVCDDVVGAQGVLEMDRGHFALAQVLFEHVLTASRASGDKFWEANSLLDLSWSSEEQTHFDEALDRANDALRISLAQDYADIAQNALGNVGWAYYKLGDSEKAEQMFVEAGKEAERLGDPGDQGGWFATLGFVYADARDFKAAEQSFRQALDLAQKTKNRGDIMDALSALAFVSEQTNKLDDAKRYADQALSIARADHNGRGLVYPLLVQARLAARQRHTTAAQNTFRELAQSSDCPVFLKWEAERSLAQLYEDGSQYDAAGREYRTALTTFETARSELKHEDSRLPFLSNAARIYDDYIHFLVAQGHTAEALQVAEYSRGRTLGEGLGLLPKGSSFKPDQVDAQGVARRSSSTVLFYWLGEKQSYLWAITPGKTTLFTLPPGAEIDAAVQRYRKALGGTQDVLASADGDGQYLYRALIAPARALLKKDAKVIIIPDGSLNNLNFETVVVPEAEVPELMLANAKLPGVKASEAKLHYWIDDVTVADASSLRVLSGVQKSGAQASGAQAAGTSAAKQKRGRSLLLVGNSIAPSDRYPELPQAAAQMESVARHFPAAEQTVLTRNEATPAAYLGSNPERFSYIHFVAHGTASRLSPLDSAIVLSKGSAEDDSFKLYARDIIRRPLRADLVTISACYSAGERSYSGEGLVGLSWAFLRAGAHNVIAALWDATDAPTEQLMDKFYDELDKGATPDAALRTAKLALLHHSVFHNPFYWAPFQLYARLG